MPSTPSRPIEVPLGQRFVLALQANPTTGFEWSRAQPVPDNVVQLVNHQSVPMGDNRTVGGGEERWTFKAVGAGSAPSVLNYTGPGIDR